MAEEIWKPVVGYEGCYEVSNLGRVRSLSRTASIRCRWGGITERYVQGRVLRAHTNGKSGYYMIQLSVLGSRHPRLVHRLVAEAFIPGAEGKGFVNHVNGDKSDNRASNLEWCTRGENMLHAHATGLTESPKRPVAMLCPQTGKEIRYERQMDAEIEHGASGKPTGALHKALSSGRMFAYGKYWKYA